MRYIFGVLCLVLFLSYNAQAASNEEAATVKNCSGAALIVRQNITLPVKKHDRIFAGDLLRTGRDGTMGVIFKDNTTLSLGPRSELAIDEFLFAPSQGKLSIVTRMFRGTVAYVSGVIAKLSPQAVRFETPTATIGIRGTKFLVKVDGGETE
ncbi:FecR protein [Syntrophus gentianae]|uniref:FecR protein n=1 Tax=Syntrophus gentianae TaxID=43775 RepID=A0A1H7YV06_9BACT|nr:FecR family protein [Syntrophus gentianae]SEM49741.1 FecR protein [Syntrophus gentianae]